MHVFLITALVALSSLTAAAAPSRFYANPTVQAEAPAAFALQPSGLLAVAAIELTAQAERDAFVAAIQNDPELASAVQNWHSLSVGEQVPLLRKFFALECAVLGITPPELVIQDGAINGPAFFEFDPGQPGAGKVILNPAAFAAETNPYASLLLLIHETRHSAQFQLAFRDESPAALGYRAAFQAQKALSGRLGFCDFLTLINEYEAFLFGNYVVGKLIHFSVDGVDMGTFASQYDGSGQLKIDLLQLSREVGPQSVLEKFNALEETQYRLLYGEAN